MSTKTTNDPTPPKKNRLRVSIELYIETPMNVERAQKFYETLVNDYDGTEHKTNSTYVKFSHLNIGY